MPEIREGTYVHSTKEDKVLEFVQVYASLHDADGETYVEPEAIIREGDDTVIYTENDIQALFDVRGYTILTPPNYNGFVEFANDISRKFPEVSVILHIHSSKDHPEIFHLTWKSNMHTPDEERPLDDEYLLAALEQDYNWICMYETVVGKNAGETYIEFALKDREQE